MQRRIWLGAGIVAFGAGAALFLTSWGNASEQVLVASGFALMAAGIAVVAGASVP